MRFYKIYKSDYKLRDVFYEIIKNASGVYSSVPLSLTWILLDLLRVIAWIFRRPNSALKTRDLCKTSNFVEIAEGAAAA